MLRSTIPQTSALQTQPFPLAGGSVAAIDANAFVAQARGAVAACARAQLAEHERRDAAPRRGRARRKGRPLPERRTEARAAVDLCAAAQQQINQQR